MSDVKYDAELCERLEREAMEDDAKMSRAPWEIDCEAVLSAVDAYRAARDKAGR